MLEEPLEELMCNPRMHRNLVKTTEMDTSSASHSGQYVSVYKVIMKLN